MKKHKDVFKKFIEFENMYNGYLLARKSKRYQNEVLKYSANLEENLINAINHLQWKSYEVSQLHEFHEYYPKKRIIMALPFKDRVINCAARNILWPIYTRSFYEHSYGSIEDRGPIRAAEQVQYWMRLIQNKSDKWYIGKADIAKFFYRIPIEVQLRELGRPIDDPDMMWFLETAIKADGRPMGLPLDVTNVFEAERISGIGMQTGSLISQITGNVVLSPVDHYMKREIRIPYYIRYMDDMILMAPSKNQIWDALYELDAYLQENFALQLNNKTAIMPYNDGVEFVGKRIWTEKIELRKKTSLQMKRHLSFVKDKYSKGEVPYEYARSVIVSYLGLMQHCNNNALRDKVLEDFVLIQNSR